MLVEDKVVNAEWYTALLEEYKSLRTEALTARDAQQSILRLAVPLLAALIGLGVSVSLKDESVVGGLLLAVSVPIVVALTFEMWVAEVQRSVRAGSVVAAIERRLGELFDGRTPGSPMGWELWLRSETRPPHGKKQERSQQQGDSVFSAAVIFVFLLIVAVISAGLGIYFLGHHGHSAEMWVTGGAISVGFLLLFVRAVFAASRIERLNEVPEGDEVWPADTAVD